MNRQDFDRKMDRAKTPAEQKRIVREFLRSDFRHIQNLAIQLNVKPPGGKK